MTDFFRPTHRRWIAGIIGAIVLLLLIASCVHARPVAVGYTPPTTSSWSNSRGVTSTVTSRQSTFGSTSGRTSISVGVGDDCWSPVEEGPARAEAGSVHSGG